MNSNSGTGQNRPTLGGAENGGQCAWRRGKCLTNAHETHVCIFNILSAKMKSDKTVLGSTRLLVTALVSSMCCLRSLRWLAFVINGYTAVVNIIMLASESVRGLSNSVSGSVSQLACWTYWLQCLHNHECLKDIAAVSSYSGLSECSHWTLGSARWKWTQLIDRTCRIMLQISPLWNCGALNWQRFKIFLNFYSAAVSPQLYIQAF